MNGHWRRGSLIIRYAERSNISEIAAILADDEVCRWLWFGPLSAADAEAYFGPIVDAQAAARSGGGHAKTTEFVLRDGRTDRFLGHGACAAVDGSPGGYEIGFALGRKDRGWGHGTQLGRFLVAYALGPLRARRIEAACLAGNAASARLLEGLGLRPEGTRRAYRVMRGEPHDERLFGALAGDLDGEACRRWAEEWGLGPA